MTMNVLDPTIRAGIERLRASAQEAQTRNPFPNWPDDRRAAPNDMIRSALFGVVKRGRRKMLDKAEIPAPPGWKLYYTGRRLDQIDLDIWLEVMHHARNTTPGEAIRFTLRSILRALGHHDGASAYEWLKDRLESMTLGGFSYQSTDGKKAGATGSLFRDFHIDKATGEGVVETNPRLRSLYESITYLDFAGRLALGGQLSKWLHVLTASHARWMPTKVETLMLQSGVSFARIRDFRADLKESLDELKEHQLIRAWSIDAADLVHIVKDGPPTQRRHLAACSTN
jgi:TrfA protein